jgi:LysR family glycine cleavage system transcriptional activator
MTRLFPSLLGLEAFHVAATLASFSAAGRELNITQGAVSHRIKTLEEQLGVTLFVRGPRRVELSEAGRALQRHAAAAFTSLAAGLRAIEDLSTEGLLTVSCSPSFAIRWLVPRLHNFRQAVPDLEVRVSADDRLAEPGRSGIDVCIRFGPGGYRGVAAERLTDEVVGPVASPTLLALRPADSPADLLTHTLLHDEIFTDDPEHIGWKEWLDRVGVPLKKKTKKRGLRFSHSHLALSAAMSGQGVALARHTLTQDDVAAGNLVRLFEEQAAPCNTAYWLVTPPGPNSEKVESFRTWLLYELSAAATTGYGPEDDHAAQDDR